MANCGREKLIVAALEEAVADAEPGADASASERASARRRQAALRMSLQRARADLKRCEDEHRWLEARFHVVRMENNDGSNGTALTAAQAQQWFDTANRVFARARVRFAFDQAAGFETRRNTRLNEVWVDSGLDVDRDAVDDAKAISNEFRESIVVIARTSRTITPAPAGGCGPGQGCSWWESNHIIMPSFDPNWLTGFSHELGHYLGLPHTFHLDKIDTTHDAEIIFDLLNRDQAVFDNDAEFVNDTPPEVIINDQDATTNTTVKLRDATFQLLRDNIMSYYRPLVANGKTVTQGQAQRVRQILVRRRGEGLSITEITP